MVSDNKLVKRYLIWCFKTTKEDLDRINRYFTQSTVDQFLLKALKEDAEANAISESIDEFEKYMQVKLNKAKEKKIFRSADRSHFSAVSLSYQAIRSY